MVGHVLDALEPLGLTRTVVVVGHGADQMIATITGSSPNGRIDFVEQVDQRGTGDAVRVALGAFDEADSDGVVVVLPGDAPLLRSETLGRLVAEHRDRGAAATLLTARLEDPTGYGRILRDDRGGVVGVVEQADATDEQRLIDEVNTSMYCFEHQALAVALGEIAPDNAQGEWYLTDVVGVLCGSGRAVAALVVDDASEVQGVNDRVHLAEAEAVFRDRINESWMRAGVTLVDPGATYIDADVHLGEDVTVFPGSVLRGHTVVADGCAIGPNVCMTDASVGAGARVGAGSVLDAGAVIDAGSEVPPLSHVTGAARRGSE